MFVISDAPVTGDIFAQSQQSFLTADGIVVGGTKTNPIYSGVPATPDSFVTMMRPPTPTPIAVIQAATPIVAPPPKPLPRPVPTIPAPPAIDVQLNDAITTFVGTSDGTPLPVLPATGFQTVSAAAAPVANAGGSIPFSTPVFVGAIVLGLILLLRA